MEFFITFLLSHTTAHCQSEALLTRKSLAALDLTEREGGEEERREREGGEEGRKERERGRRGREEGEGERKERERGRRGREEGEGERVMIIPYTPPCICHGQCTPVMSHVYISHYFSNCVIEQNIYPAKTLGGARMYMYTPHTYTQPA